MERDKKEHDEAGEEDVVEDAGLLAPGALYVSVVYTATSLSANSFFFSLPENCAGCPVGFYSHETSLLL